MTPEKLQQLFENGTDARPLSNELLTNIKLHSSEIVNLFAAFDQYEEDFVYRFYHHSFKVFAAINLLRSAQRLFQDMAPDSVTMNAWFESIIQDAISKKFDPEKTNAIWREETQPILEAFWHSKYFLQQMKEATKLESAPQVLPSGWAAVLYLYNLR